MASDSLPKCGTVREWIEARRKEQSRTGATAVAPAREAGSAAELILTTTGLRSTGVANVATGASFEVGSQIGKYVLTDLVGKGATARVYRAVHRTLKKAVAIKVINLGHDQNDPANARQLDQLRREAELLAQLNHPNVVRVLDFDDSHEQPHLVMEHVDGMALNELLSHCGRLRPDKAARIVGQIAQGLAAAQELGIVHRDVKPGNILLGRDGSIKLADLGLAIIQSSWLDGADPGTSLPSMMAGTVAYVSPEQANSADTVDHRADVYSLGATFYHAVTGELPFKGKSRMEIIFKQAKEYPALPHHLVPGLDSIVSDVIAKMMAKDPSERYQTYDELLQALKAIGSR